jgi:hypothetical protein
MRLARRCPAEPTDTPQPTRVRYTPVSKTERRLTLHDVLESGRLPAGSRLETDYMGQHTTPPDCSPTARSASRMRRTGRCPALVWRSSKPSVAQTSLSRSAQPTGGHSGGPPMQRPAIPSRSRSSANVSRLITPPDVHAAAAVDGLEVRHDPSAWCRLVASAQVESSLPSAWSHPGRPCHKDRIARGIARWSAREPIRRREAVPVFGGLVDSSLDRSLGLHVECGVRPRSGAVRPATCGPDERLVTARARCCPRLIRRLRSQDGRRGVLFPSGRGWLPS